MLFTFTLSVAGQLPPRVITYLKDSRQNITFVPYTEQQKVDMAKGVVDMLSVYVHTEKKVQDYGSEFPDIAPLPRAKNIQAQAANMTDKDLHYAFASLFMSLRDFHTNYFMPPPHRCYSAALAPQFQLIGSADLIQEPKMILSNFSARAAINDLSGTELNKMKFGDELVSVDGMPLRDFCLKNKFKTGGANDYATYRACMMSVSIVSGTSSPMPEANNRTLQMKKPTGEAYEVVLPWIASAKPDCLQEAAAAQKSIKAPAKKSSFPPSLQDFIDTFDIHSDSELPLKDTAEDLLKWAVFDPQGANLGVLSIASFEPKGPVEGLLDILQGLLTNELADTKAIIIDVRNNGGGDATMANKIPQLFIKDFKNSFVRALVTPINEKLFATGAGGDDWKEAYTRVKPGDVYTPLLQFNSDAESNARGTAFYKPVGVLTNANCYSACDIMSAHFQDNGVTVFGEDGTTGAGGANVVEYNGFFVKALNDTFKPMPFTKEMPQFHQDLRVSWRQVVRVGKNDGKLIEDDGVVSDVIVRPEASDVLAGTSDTQWKRIAQKLQEIGETEKRNGLYFTISPDFGDAAVGQPIVFDVVSAGFKEIIITDEGKEIAHQQVKNLEKTKGLFKASAPASTGFQKLLVSAIDQAGRSLVKTFRTIRIVPGKDSYKQLSGTEKWDKKLDAQNTVVYNFGSKPEDGWSSQNGTIGIGYGQYKNSVNSTLSLFYKPAANVTFSVKAQYDTEQDFDYFQVGFRDSKSTVQLLTEDSETKGPGVIGISGKGNLTKTFTIKPEGPFEIFLRFLSDEGVTSSGISLESLEVSGVFDGTYQYPTPPTVPEGPDSPYGPIISSAQSLSLSLFIFALFLLQ